MRRPPPRPTLFPYTTLFRSVPLDAGSARLVQEQVRERVREVAREGEQTDRKSTRLNSSHVSISYAVFCLKKKNCSRSAWSSMQCNGTAHWWLRETQAQSREA